MSGKKWERDHTVPLETLVLSPPLDERLGRARILARYALHLYREGAKGPAARIWTVAIFLHGLSHLQDC